MGKESSNRKKTPYLETLENLFQELTQARSMSSGGRKLILLGLLYDVHRVHQFFLQIENNLSESIGIHNILLYDADVEYNDWSVKLDIKFDVKAFYMPDEEENDADAESVKGTLWHVFDTFSRDELKNISCDRTNNVQHLLEILTNDASIDNLVLLLNESIVALRESLLQIHTCISRHRMTNEDGIQLYKHELEYFIQTHESEVVEEFESWKDQFDDNEELVMRNIHGKYYSEMLSLFMSEFLKSRIAAQLETDKSGFESEMAKLRFVNVPADIDTSLYYSALRELFEYKNEVLVPHPGRIGKYFFKHRKEVDAKQRAALFKFIKMIELIEEEKKPKAEKREEVNYEGIKIAMIRTYFPKCYAALNKGYNAEWLDSYMTALMDSEHKDEIAMAWANQTKRKQVCCAIIGALNEKGVLKGSYAALAEMIYNGDKDEMPKDRKRNVRTLGKYIGEGKNHVIGKWTEEY